MRLNLIVKELRCFVREGNISKALRINTEIRSSQVRLISDSGEQLGILSLQEAIKLAQNRDLDLVEVAPEASPPVCKMMDYGKHVYQIKKRLKESKKRQHTIQVKEVVFRPQIDEHDFNVKKRRTIKFLEEGNRVKITVRFRGRELRRKELGQNVIDRLILEVEDYGDIEGSPVATERNINIVIAPKKQD